VEEKMIVIAATQNKHKLEEIGAILKDFDIELKSANELGYGDIEVIEDRDTFEGNSMKKAEEIMEASGIPALADDSGLMVDALDGRPGVFSARYSGENATDKSNNEKLKEELKDETNRKAKFVSVISLAYPDGKRISVRGELNGVIGYEEKGDSGFGYDPLFIVEEYNKTLAELGSEIKNQISHRANALEKLKVELTKGV